MNEVTIFIQHNLVLVCGFLVVVTLLLILELRDKGTENVALAAADAVKKINHEASVLIDIRSKEDFDKEHIINAINIPMKECVTTNVKLKKLENKSIILVCASGSQSRTQLKNLQSMNFERVFYLQGGLQSWISESLPVLTN